jgi:hypothetical protein
LMVGTTVRKSDRFQVKENVGYEAYPRGEPAQRSPRSAREGSPSCTSLGMTRLGFHWAGSQPSSTLRVVKTMESSKTWFGRQALQTDASQRRAGARHSRSDDLGKPREPRGARSEPFATHGIGGRVRKTHHPPARLGDESRKARAVSPGLPPGDQSPAIAVRALRVTATIRRTVETAGQRQGIARRLGRGIPSVQVSSQRPRPGVLHDQASWIVRASCGRVNWPTPRTPCSVRCCLPVAGEAYPRRELKEAALIIRRQTDAWVLRKTNGKPTATASSEQRVPPP